MRHIKGHTRKGSVYYTDAFRGYQSLKRFLYNYRGVSKYHFPMYLKEIEYRFNHRKENLFWADSVLPADAVLLSTHRSVALAPREVVPMDLAAYVNFDTTEIVRHLNQQDPDLVALLIDHSFARCK